MAISAQLDLFEEAEVDLTERPPVRTTVQLGSHTAKPNLAKMRRQALKEFVELLEELEGKNIFIGFCGGSRSHYWCDKLRLGKLHAEWHGTKENPGVIVLWGKRLCVSSQSRFTPSAGRITPAAATLCGYWTSGMDLGSILFHATNHPATPAWISSYLTRELYSLKGES
jgi:hypothetical protein